MITPESTDLLRESISTLVDTLKNIEVPCFFSQGYPLIFEYSVHLLALNSPESQGITSDISVFTGDEATRKNLKLLIKSLSRLL